MKRAVLSVVSMMWILLHRVLGTSLKVSNYLVGTTLVVGQFMLIARAESRALSPRDRTAA